jgi:hypothetical protein
MPAKKSKSRRPATYEDATLLLRLYELRRDDKMRTARAWFAKSFRAGTLEAFDELCPAGSEENASFRMVVSYWEMAASFVTRGILHQDLFMQNSSELGLVWERVRRVAPALREKLQNQNLFSNIEKVAAAMDEYRLPESAFGV